MSLSGYLLNEVRLTAERPTMEEMRRSLHQREPVQLPDSAAAAVRAERDARLSFDVFRPGSSCRSTSNDLQV
jgi:hypothetical protein